MAPFGDRRLLAKVQLFEIILPLFLSLVSEFDGVVRTVVIAGEAGEAILVVKPLGIFAMTALDIAHRTDIGADATFHTLVFFYMESLVGDEHVLEETAHYLGEEPWDRSFYQSIDTFFPVENLLANHGKFLSRFRFLPDFLLLGVYIHKGKTHVGFRHNEGVGGRYLRDAQGLKRRILRDNFVQVFDGEADEALLSAETEFLSASGSAL